MLASARIGLDVKLWVEDRADIIDKLRKHGALSLVAPEDNMVIGHISLSPVNINSAAGSGVQGCCPANQ